MESFHTIIFNNSWTINSNRLNAFNNLFFLLCISLILETFNSKRRIFDNMPVNLRIRAFSQEILLVQHNFIHFLNFFMQFELPLLRKIIFFNNLKIWFFKIFFIKKIKQFFCLYTKFYKIFNYLKIIIIQIWILRAEIINI